MTTITASDAAGREGEYAVIRTKASGYRIVLFCKPWSVMRVEKRTATSLMGMILDSNGDEIGGYGDYDSSPQYEKHHNWDRKKPERLRAGRVNLDRLLTTFPTLDAAHAALKSAKQAWEAAEDRAAVTAAGKAARDAEDALRVEESRLREEMRERLADLSKAASNAKSAVSRANCAMHETMTAAALAAMTEPLPAALPNGGGA